ncbi:MAG TPA: dienelactone hydrolase family protein [Vicinamibacterales bacterium]|nr:dienelactone hydrolase family protein [Vicinamibacterales bacterium]
MEQTTLTLQTADGPMDAYRTAPDGTGQLPALLVIQEAFGVNNHIRNVCRRLSAHGYVALAPELFHRTGRGVDLGYTDMSQVMPHFTKLTNSGILMDVQAGLAALHADPRVDPARIGVVGFCVGGLATFIAAEHTNAAAFVSFYGGGVLRARPNIALEPVIDDAERIRRPFLLIYGGQDQSIPADDVQAIDDRLTSLGKVHRVVTMPDGGHGFACDDRAAFHQPSSDEAWRITYDWLAEQLKQGN